MGQVNLSDYKNIYLQTAKEYINNISLSYSKLSKNSQDSEAINTIHISSHSLKSQSQVMGFTNITNLCADIEKVSSDILNKANSVDDAFMVLLKESIDKLKLEFNLIERGDAETSSA